MPKRDESKYQIIVPGEPEEVTEIRNRILASFNELVFIDEGHKYFLGKEELISVSAVAHQFREEFDAIEKSSAYAQKHGGTAEYWQDKWKFNNLCATVTGTQVHSYAESLAWIHAKHPENITPDNKYKYIADKNWLIPTRPKEEASLKFWQEFPENMHIVLPETKVFSTGLKTNYAGTFDLLLYYKHPTDDSKSGLVIGDWKTNRSLVSDFSRQHKKMCKAPFNDLYDEDLSSYTIQLSCYQIPLEDIGLKVIGRRVIWLKEDGTYETVKIPSVTEELREFLR